VTRTRQRTVEDRRPNDFPHPGGRQSPYLIPTLMVVIWATDSILGASARNMWSVIKTYTPRPRLS